MLGFYYAIKSDTNDQTIEYYVDGKIEYHADNIAGESCGASLASYRGYERHLRGY